MISAVGIVVPARDERRRIQDCVRGLRTALRALPPGVDTVVCVVADRCVDDTARLARAAFGDWSAARVVRTGVQRTIGEVRDLGFRHVRAALAAHPPAGTLLLSTDADSVVAPDWAHQHLRIAASGVHAVAGVTELIGQRPLPPSVAARYAAILATARRSDGHGNVYAANLGVRADAYLAVGGFGATATGEDHRLWRRLGSAGYRRCYADEPKVLTSARRHGRAPGGLADLLRTLHDPQATGYSPIGGPDRRQERKPWPSQR
jgi:hypothetical protein